MRILVTGGASGLGEAITRRLAKELGNVLFITYHRSKKNAEIIEEDLSNVHSIYCDFCNSNDIQNLQKQMIDMQLDVLINNAYVGEYSHTHFHNISGEVFLNDFTNSVVPTIAITQTAIQEFRKRKKGNIVTILTSFLFSSTPIGSAVYLANKAYLAKLAQVWALENVKFNICSNTVSPSFMLTNAGKNIDERLIELMKDAHPIKKLLTADEAAESVMTLISNTQNLNGFNLIVNSAKDVV